MQIRRYLSESHPGGCAVFTTTFSFRMMSWRGSGQVANRGAEQCSQSPFSHALNVYDPITCLPPLTRSARHGPWADPVRVPRPAVRILLRIPPIARASLAIWRRIPDSELAALCTSPHHSRETPTRPLIDVVNPPGPGHGHDGLCRNTVLRNPPAVRPPK